MSEKRDNSESTSRGESLDSARHDEFLRLYSQHQRNVFAYISTLIPNPDDVDEVLQETSIVLWKKFSSFKTGTDFGRWACGVAHYEVLRFRRANPRLVPLDEGLLSRIASEHLAMQRDLDDRRAALAYCIDALPADDRNLLDLCYGQGSKSTDVAERLHRPVNSVYKSLSRIRRALRDCVVRRLTAEGRT